MMEVEAVRSICIALLAALNFRILIDFATSVEPQRVKRPSHLQWGRFPDH